MWWIIVWLGFGFIFACMTVDKGDGIGTFLKFMFVGIGLWFSFAWWLIYSVLFGGKGVR